MKLTRRCLFAISLAAGMLPALPVLAQKYPTQPIKLIVGVPPGGAVDGFARSVALYLSPGMGVPFIVENRPGASNKIANQYVANSQPDGHTLLSIGSSQPIAEAAALAAGVERPFDTLRDFALVGTLVTNTMGLVVRADLPARNVNEFIALAKAKPGAISYGSTGIGKTDHLAVELLSQQTGMQLLHVPFKGMGDAVAQMLPGRIDAIFNSIAPVAAHIRDGKLRVLGVIGGERSQLFPDVPTFAEAVPLPGYKVNAWIGIGAPAKTPVAVVNRLSTEFKKMLSDPAFVKKTVTPQGFEAWHQTPADTTAMFKGELEKYTKVMKDLGLKIVD